MNSKKKFTLLLSASALSMALMLPGLIQQGKLQ